MPKDYSYQKEINAELRQTDDNSLIVLPPGGGKSHIFGTLAKEFYDQGMRVTLVAHRDTLLNQAMFHFCNHGIPTYAIGHIRGETRYPLNPGCPIQIGSIQTMSRRKYFPKSDLVIIDEAHNARAKSYARIFQGTAERIIGFSATPVKPMKDLFSNMIVGPKRSQLIANGYLSPVKVFDGSLPDLQGLKLKSNGWDRDYDPAELSLRLCNDGLTGDAVENWLRYGEGRSTVVFTCDRAHSLRVLQAYRAAGLAAEIIDGTMNTKERQDIFRRFLTKTTKILINVNILGEGFDLATFAKFYQLPPLDIGCVQDLVPSQSYRRVVQTKRRCERWFEGKEYGIYFDHGGNFNRHQLDKDPEWSLEEGLVSGKSVIKRKVLKRKAPEMVEKECPDCLAIAPITKAVCECGYRFRTKTSFSNRLLVERQGTATEALLADLNQGTAPLFALSNFLARPDLTFIDYANAKDILGHSWQWAWQEWRKANPHVVVKYAQACKPLGVPMDELKLFDKGLEKGKVVSFLYRNKWQEGRVESVKGDKISILSDSTQEVCHVPIENIA